MSLIDEHPDLGLVLESEVEDATPKLHKEHPDLRMAPVDQKIDYDSPNPLDHYDLRIIPADSRDEESADVEGSASEEWDAMPAANAENLLQQLALSLEKETGL